MNLREEWSEIPPGRRHVYFYLCLLLVTIALLSVRRHPAASKFNVDPLVKIVELENAPLPQLNQW